MYNTPIGQKNNHCFWGQDIRVNNIAPHENIQEKLKNGEYVDTVISNKGNIYGIKPAGNHGVVSKNPGLKGVPDSSVDILNDKGDFENRRWFNKDGVQFKDIDFTNHNKPQGHPEFPHAHMSRESENRAREEARIRKRREKRGHKNE